MDDIFGVHFAERGKLSCPPELLQNFFDCNEVHRPRFAAAHICKVRDDNGNRATHNFRTESILRASRFFQISRDAKKRRATIFWGRRHSRFQNLQFAIEFLRAILPDQIPQFILVRNVPAGIARTVMRQRGHFICVGPAANPPAGNRDEMLDDRRAEHFQEKIFVRFLLAPKLARVFLAFFSGAHDDEQRAVRLRLDKLIVQLFGRKFRSGHAQSFVHSISIHRFAARKTKACRFLKNQSRAAIRFSSRERPVNSTRFPRIIRAAV